MTMQEKLAQAEQHRAAQLEARANAAAEKRRASFKARGRKSRRSALFPLSQIDQQF